ncbi:MAG: hypothetical protein GX914_02105 [Erysipelotrichia bacterium]|mgnify:CR=1 FL=1|jgi:hypothetical protein|nr:hypothetical protein [Erysipelotrichia bacterium]
MKKKAIPILVLIIIILGIIILNVIPKKQDIYFEEIKITIPFIVKETEELEYGYTYRNKVENYNFYQNITSITVEKSTLSIDEFHTFKYEWFEKENYKEFGNIYSSFYGYEIIYQLYDAGPTTYVLLLHIFSSDNIYRIVTRNLQSYELLKLIESIALNHIS